MYIGDQIQEHIEKAKRYAKSDDHIAAISESLIALDILLLNAHHFGIDEVKSTCIKLTTTLRQLT